MGSAVAFGRGKSLRDIPLSFTHRRGHGRLEVYARGVPANSMGQLYPPQVLETPQEAIGTGCRWPTPSAAVEAWEMGQTLTPLEWSDRLVCPGWAPWRTTRYRRGGGRP